MEDNKKVTDTKENTTEKVSADENSKQNIKIDAQAVTEDVTDKGDNSDKKQEVKAEAVKDSNIDIVDVKELDAKKQLEEQRKLAIEKQRVVRRKKKIKKLIKWVVVLAILGIAAWIGISYLSYNAQKKLSSTNTTQTGEVKREDISDTITTTGTVQSKDIRTITSANTGVTISKVNFAVGDFVNEGDVIVEFSREDIEEKINQAEEDLAEAKANEALTNQYKASQHEYDYGTASYNNYKASTQTQTSANTLARAQEDLNLACQNRSKYVDEYNEAVNNIGATTQAYNEANAYLSLFKATNTTPTVTNVGEFLNTDINANQALTYLGYQYTLTEFQDYVNDLKTKVSEYENTIKNYDTQIASYDQKITSAQRSLSDAQKNYNEQLASESDTNRQSSNNIVTSDYNYNSYIISANDKVTQAERSLEEQQNKLDDYIVYAPISGLVTSVSAQEGNGYVNTSGGLMTIQAVDSYEITTQIDEYDINSVKLGQRVVIQTDATGDEVLEGEVSFVSPIATSSSSSSSNSSGGASSSSNTYEVKINILSDISKIKLGMSAKLNIIVDEHSNVLTVPYDAIEETDDGQHYVTVVSADSVAKKPDFNKDSSNSSGITVVGTDGKVTGAPDMDGEKPSGMPEKPDSNDSFIKYLFSSKSKTPEINDTGLSSAGKKVYVQIGIEDDYSTEISSDEIKEGDVVILTSDDSNQMGGFGGMMMGGPGGF